jgi:hypothetical protein
MSGRVSEGFIGEWGGEEQERDEEKEEEVEEAKEGEGRLLLA